MATFKELGNKAFTQKDFQGAIDHFTKGIDENPKDETLYSNRSACYYNLSNSLKALADAEKCIELKADWDKGHQRKAMALRLQGKYDDSIKCFEQSLALNAANAQAKQGLEEVRKEKAASESEDDGMFGPSAMAKLMANPRTAAYFQDPKFRNTFEICKQNP